MAGRAVYLPWNLSQRGDGFTDLGGLAEGPQASGADLNPDRLAVLHQGLLVNVGHESGFGVAVGVADVVAGHPSL